MDVASYNLFMYTISFLRELLRHYQENLLDAQHAAKLAASILAQIPIDNNRKTGSAANTPVVAQIPLNPMMTSPGSRRGLRIDKTDSAPENAATSHAAMSAGGTDLRVAFEQLCIAMQYFLEFDTQAGEGGHSELAGQLAVEAASHAEF